ncbi:unnamed protein product [Penicillium salamii]|nr:unnamed protein product [Penicillium salamii]CAG7960235.1 unnamed protein product [Penicillium salamii]CAG8272264.1 unnamed protein product [Penicillium salamii]
MDLAGQSLADSILLQKIDKLFECNVGEHVDLPQLVVVGDQSSGKSSVLEGLTKVNFPRDSGLCTRFATKITFRRDLTLTAREIYASIFPSPEVDENERQKLQAWKAAGLQSLSSNEFSQMMREVHEQMRISTQDGDNKPTFSKNVLQLEIRGPDESHLSVIDVPGIFQNTTDRTTKEDIALVKNMALEYMKKTRSIILAVVPANVDLATQAIIEMAHDEDPEELRTMKIMTKPDLVDKGAEQKVVHLINNENTQGLGWVLVRNLSQKELNDGDAHRDQAEKMFHQTSPWNQIPSESFGIKALQIKLQELLTATVRRQFPKVRDEVAKLLKETKDAMEILGDRRDTPEKQRGVLLEIATVISTRNNEFSGDIGLYGHSYAFGSKSKGASTNDAINSSTSDIPNRYVKESLDVDDIKEILVEREDVQAPEKHQIFEWVSKAYEDARGFEIGTFNHTILSTLMKQQTVKWPTLSRGYVSDIICYVHNFIQTVLGQVCKNRQIYSRILSVLREDLIRQYCRAISMVDFLLTIERKGTPLTLNHYMNDNLEKCRQRRLRDNIASKTIDNCSHGEVVRVDDLFTHNHMSNDKHTTHDIHDILEAYYKVARKRFVDNVCMQAVDHHLVTGPETPMRLLSPKWVNKLSNEELEAIAGEEMGSKRKRRQLKKRIQDLEAGKKVLLA